MGAEEIPSVEAILSSLPTGFTLAWRRERDGHVQFMVVSIDEVKRAIRENRPAAAVMLPVAS